MVSLRASNGLKIIVCIKQVPGVSDPQFDPVRKTLVREGVPNVLNPLDRPAVAEAVRLKDAHCGKVTVVTMGPPFAEDALEDCLALGADQAFHLVDKAFAGADTLATARALTLAIRQEPFDLILCGKYSTDAETGQVGPEVAEMLDIPQVTSVAKLDVNLERRTIWAERETDEGVETIECELPALITAAERLCKSKPVTDKDREQARKKPLKSIAASDLSADLSLFGLAGSPTSVLDIIVEKSERKKLVIQEESIELACERLIEHLERDGLLSRFQEKDADVDWEEVAPIVEGREIWVIAEEFLDGLRPVTLELLGKGVELSRKLAGELAAVAVGENVSEYAETLCAYGANKVYVIQHQAFRNYSIEGFTNVITDAIKRYRPYVVLVPSTPNGRDFAPRVAARLQLGLTGDCIGLEVDEAGRLIQLKPAFGGGVVAPIVSSTTPQMATVRPGMLKAVRPKPGRRPRIVKLDITPGRIRTRWLSSRLESEGEGARLDDAEIVVCAGAGVGGPENLKSIQHFADVLGGRVAATRKIVDLGWIARQHQVGLTGKAIAPKLYIAVGVRGAVNHLVGIRKAGTVVAINVDPKAPIFKNADYGIVGDYRELLPRLEEAFLKAKQRFDEKLRSTV